MDEQATPNAFLLERYKYILEQKRELNRTTFQIAATFQAGVGLIGAAQFSVLAAFHRASLDRELATMFSWVLLGLSAVLTTFALCLLGGGISSWLSYRRDEAEVERIVYGNPRPLPSVRDVFRWYETYVLAAVALLFLIHVVMIHEAVLPYLSKVRPPAPA